MGLLILIIGSILNTIALKYGNQLLLASSSSLTIVHNTILSVIFLGENFTKSHGAAIILICMGSIMFLCAGKNPDNIEES